MNAHVVVALSGGVDSAVAAALLKAQGYRVSGLFMKNWEDDDTDSFCSSAADYKSARAVAEILEIPLHSANFSAQYRERVFARFLADCQAGLTPNPDILCNREIKFDVFWRHAQKLGADLMATGHYARITPNGSAYNLLAGRDRDKDQSYFLHTIDHVVLPYVRFPIGDFQKTDIRERARMLGLPNANRKGSSGICFIGERHFRSFLQRYLTGTRGPMYSVDAQLMGEHEGLMFYTIGQRHGLAIGGPGDAWYVVDKRPSDNALIIAQGTHHPALYRETCETLTVQWLGDAPPLPWEGHVKIRYRQEAQAVSVESIAHGGLHLRFKDPQRAVTPGQSAVFYDADRCLGGAIIAPTPPL